MPDLDELTIRPATYLVKTGLPHLAAGILMFLIGASDLVLRFLSKTDVTQEVSLGLALCAAVAVRSGSNWIKNRVVFPRGGYAKVRPGKWTAVATALILVTFLLLWTFVARWAGFAFVILLAVATLASGWRVKAGLAVYLLCLVSMMWAFPITGVEKSAVLQFGAGVPLAVAGAFILRTFLKANPKRPKMSDG